MLKKIFKKIKIYSTIVLIIGVAIYLAFVYNAAKSIKIVDKRIGGVNLKNPLMPDEYEVKFIIVRFILRMNISEKAKNHIFLLSME